MFRKPVYALAVAKISDISLETAAKYELTRSWRLAKNFLSFDTNTLVSLSPQSCSEQSSTFDKALIQCTQNRLILPNVNTVYNVCWCRRNIAAQKRKINHGKVSVISFVVNETMLNRNLQKKKKKKKKKMMMMNKYKHAFRFDTITNTCLDNIDVPLKPHFYIVKLGFTGVYIIFLISAQKHIVCTH